MTQVALSGLSHVCVCTANAKDLIAMRWYTVAFRKSGSSVSEADHRVLAYAAFPLQHIYAYHVSCILRTCLIP